MKSGVLDTILEYIPETIIKKYKLPTLRTALIWIHAPQKKGDADSARKRFAFEEVFFIQLSRQIERKEYESLFSYKLAVPKKDIADFISRFPFTPTAGQNKVIDQILGDLIKDKPMSRLVEGDVGSGKTFIAATVAYAVIKNRPVGQNFGNIQVAYMAPTEILATQLFENFISYFAHTGISIGLITGSGCRKFPSKVASATNSWTTISRTQLLKWVKNGEIPILIGTHALIQKSVDFEDLGLVIIDEQHRFGTNQRMKLAKKEGHSPHFLSMTATPIPRTLTMTIYGDLDLSVLDEMPKGRKQVITEIVPPDKRGLAYQAIRRELKAGRQLYVICPRINEPDPDQELALNVKSVTAEAKRLKNEVFPEYEIGILHSKMTKQKKEEMMMDFSEKKIDILVATSVIEVGVNVPNATVIIIEGAERFGLAQLHQLRGRVIRSNHQAYCYLLADAKTQKTLDRLKALVTAKNGFELAELDLALRGAGELAGTKQWGLSDLGMEAIKNIKMVEAARTEAISIAEKNHTLDSHPKLRKALSDQKLEEMHFE
jgi:ATP-dependent DNA helicase RecG